MADVSASLLSKPEEMTEAVLISKVQALESSGIDMIHWDVMDGVYNPNNTWDYQGPEVIRGLKKTTELPFEAHLMIADPFDKLNLFVDCDAIIFHYEAYRNREDMIKNTIARIRYLRKEAGIAMEPDTPVSAIEKYLDNLDLVLVMTVKTGYAGQNFIDKSDKIRLLFEIRKRRNLKFRIAVDGGIDNITGKLCREAGADILASASYIMKNPAGYKAAIDSLRG